MENRSGEASRGKRWVIAPEDNVFNSNMSTQSFQYLSALSSRVHHPEVAVAQAVPVDGVAAGITVVDSIDLNESTLVEMSDEQAAALRRKFPSLRIAEEVWLRMLRPRQFGTIRAPRPSRSKTVPMLQVTVLDSKSGEVIAGADVTVIFDEKVRSGIGDLKTDTDGTVLVRLPARVRKVDLVLVSPDKRHWPAAVRGIKVEAAKTTGLEMRAIPIDAAFRCSLRRACPDPVPEDGKGVRVAVIDGGVTPPPGMNFRKGMNVTGVEPEDEFEDHGSGHGTHVAGIIARLAPAAEIHSYRVFTRDAEFASEFAIAKAIRHAVEDGCDLINLSLGQNSEPVSVTREIRRARALGSVCLAAAGNDGEPYVNYPARSPSVIAVSALGVDGAWPEGAAVDMEIAATPAPVGGFFFASFSNNGPEIDLIAPGVGVISDVSADTLGVMSGTSMACPASTGLIARALARSPNIYKMDRDQARSDDIIKLALGSAVRIGWDARYEGQGLVRT